MNKHTLLEVDSRLSTHEEVCALRYEEIGARLKRLEGILMASAGAIILLLFFTNIKYRGIFSYILFRYLQFIIYL